MAQQTNEMIKRDEEKSSSSNTTFWRFAANEASRYFLDKERSLNVIIFKRVRFMIEGAIDCESEAFMNEVYNVKRSIMKLIKMFRIMDTSIEQAWDKQNGLDISTSGKSAHLLTYIFPAIDGVNKVLENFYSFARNAKNPFFKLEVKVTDICQVTYDNRVLDENLAFIRGYIVGTNFPQIEFKGNKHHQKTYLRSDCAIAESVGFTNADVNTFNKYNSTFNRVRLYKGGEDGKEVSTSLPFRGKLSIVAYKAVDCISSGVVKFERKTYNISYTYNKDQDHKSITSYGPKGIRVTSDCDFVETGNLIDVFYKDGVNLVTTAFLKAEESDYPEWSIFKNEAAAFSSTFISNFEPTGDDDEMEENGDKDPNSTSEEVETSEAVVTVEPDVEESETEVETEEKPKKTKKSSKSKKAKSEEETPAEEPVEKTEETSESTEN